MLKAKGTRRRHHDHPGSGASARVAVWHAPSEGAPRAGIAGGVLRISGLGLLTDVGFRPSDFTFLACLLWLCVSGSLCFGADQFPQRPFVLVNEAELAALRTDLAAPGWKASL